VFNNDPKLKKMFEDIVAQYAAVEAGTYELREDVCDVAKIVGNALGLVRNLAVQNELDVRLDVPDDMPFLFADERCVRQVVVNFLSNAIKFTGSGSVTLRLEAAAGEDRMQAVTMSVEDTGPGMTPDQLERLFTPFDQLDAGTARRHGGSGLGLAISRGLVAAWGGEMQVRSERGRGTELRITQSRQARAWPQPCGVSAA